MFWSNESHDCKKKKKKKIHANKFLLTIDNLFLQNEQLTSLLVFSCAPFICLSLKKFLP